MKYSKIISYSMLTWLGIFTLDWVVEFLMMPVNTDKITLMGMHLWVFEENNTLSTGFNPDIQMIYGVGLFLIIALLRCCWQIKKHHDR